MRKKAGMNLVNGNILKTLILYSLPLIATQVVQVLFHAADVAVLGIMAEDSHVAAVGACGYLISLLVSLFSGLATGANVLISKRVGACDREGARRAVGVSLTVGLVSGLILMVIALVGARTFLIWMNCQTDVLDMATLYLRIYFLGMPVLMLYNFVAGVLRSVGDSVRPMWYMLIAGILNVVLNVIFIAGLGMTVEGVAWATVLSKLVALALALRTLFKNTDYCKVERKNLRIRRTEFWEIVRVGVPSSATGVLFYIANMFVASAVNSISTDAMTANSVSSQFDGMIYQVGCAIAMGCMVMVAQNLGAKRLDRVKKTIRTGLLVASCASLLAGTFFYLSSDFLLAVMTDSPAVLSLAKERLGILAFTYFSTSMMEVLAFSLRSLDRAQMTVVVAVTCGLLGRAVWVKLIWPLYPTFWMLFFGYFVTSAVACIIYGITYIFTFRQWKKKLSQ